ERSLDRVQRAYGSGKRFAIYNTEYGYLTSPPKHPTRKTPIISTTTAGLFLNQAEYMSWRDPRMKSFSQYLLADPVVPKLSNDYGGFASGLLDYKHRAKPTYDAWRLPLYLPRTSGRSGGSLEVWGCARPVFSARMDVPADTQTVAIQFKPDSGGGFSTVKSQTITDPHGYFDTRINLRSSGTVRLAYTYPADDPLLSPSSTVHSRSVHVKLT
ncbi:MAG TPA: hypothetical protein VIM18_06565, partial [Solirubrobacteraceae bacterium]